jgi:hypothetical protein
MLSALWRILIISDKFFNYMKIFLVYSLRGRVGNTSLPYLGGLLGGRGPQAAEFFQPPSRTALRAGVCLRLLAMRYF